MTALIAVLAGSGIGLGLWLLLAGVRGTRLLPDTRSLLPSGLDTENAIGWLAGGSGNHRRGQPLVAPTLGGAIGTGR
jgi:hypothetical protein